MNNLTNWFEKGLTVHKYISSMNVHQDNLLKVYNNVSFSNEEVEYLQNFQQHQLRAVILTADWCGDAMVNLPIFMRIANEALIETRYLIRDQNLELMDQYLTNGTARSIPIIILLNKDGEEIAKWGPRAPFVQSLVDKLKQELPPKESPEHEQAFKQFISILTEKFTANESLWKEVKQDFIQLLKARNFMTYV